MIDRSACGHLDYVQTLGRIGVHPFDLACINVNLFGQSDAIDQLAADGKKTNVGATLIGVYQ